MSTGELQIFKEIWDERLPFSEISGLPLVPPNHFLWHWQFSHILNKKTYNKFRFNKRNIILMTPDEHKMLTEHPELLKGRPEWKKYFELYDSLKQEYFAQ